MGDGVRRGVVVGSTVVDENGSILYSPMWLIGYCPAEKDAVVIHMMSDGGALIVPLAARRPDTGTVTGAAVSGMLPVTGADGSAYSCRYIGTAPSVAASVLILWQNSTPWVLGTATAAATPGSSTVPPSGAGGATSGMLPVAAIDSGSYRDADGWGTSGTRPKTVTLPSVVQGTYSSYAYSGAWFYGSQASQLLGATIGRAQVRLPARLSIGASSDALVLHLWLHTNGSRPAGGVTWTLGPFDVTLPGGYVGGWVDLPLAWAPALVSGGGLGVTGSPYLGLVGLDKDPASGQINLDWTR